MDRLFLHPFLRQRELEDLCDGKFPGFGYAVLAALMADEGLSADGAQPWPHGHFNVAVTTNFDDLLADALYLFTKSRPLVIHHESLGKYIRPTRTRPLIVKLHGDHRLTPLNTFKETNALNDDFETPVLALLRDRGLVFLGYNGNDQGIAKMLNRLPAEALPNGVYWVSSREPNGVIRPWLDSRGAVWVQHHGFDELMVLVRDIFGLPHPRKDRFAEIYEQYSTTYDNLAKEIRLLPDSEPTASALKAAVRRTNDTFPDEWAAILAASESEKMAPERAETLYRNGLARFPYSAPLLGNYAAFLHTIRKQPDQAEEYYQRALKADPNHATILGNYGAFLSDIRKQPDQAEEYFQRALKADPNHANNLGNYAGFLLSLGRKTEGATILEQARSLLGESTPGDVALEVWFYVFAHFPGEMGKDALSRLKHLLANGERSPGWDLTRNVERARLDGHPDAVWLEKLAAVISDSATIDTLDQWPAWRQA